MDEDAMRRAGLALMVAGGLWAVGAVVQFRLGLFGFEDGGGYVAHQLVAMGYLGLIVYGLWVLHGARVAGDGRFSRVGLMLFAIGWAIVLAGGALNLASGDGTGPLADIGMILPALGGTLNTVTGLLAGIAVARAGRLPDWRRWSLLVYAVYYLLALWLPVVITAQPPSLMAEIGWGLCWLLVGAAAATTRAPRRATVAVP